MKDLQKTGIFSSGNSNKTKNKIKKSSTKSSTKRPSYIDPKAYCDACHITVFNALKAHEDITKSQKEILSQIDASDWEAIAKHRKREAKLSM